MRAFGKVFMPWNQRLWAALAIWDQADRDVGKCWTAGAV